MAQLRQSYEEIARRGAVVVVVGPEDRQAFASYFEREGLPFVGLPDPEHGVADLYGQQVSIFRLGRMPAQVVVDREGRIRSAHHGHSMADIPKVRDLLALLDELG
jgi:peroxiredoxin